MNQAESIGRSQFPKTFEKKGRVRDGFPKVQPKSIGRLGKGLLDLTSIFIGTGHATGGGKAAGVTEPMEKGQKNLLTSAEKLRTLRHIQGFAVGGYPVGLDGHLRWI